MRLACVLVAIVAVVSSARADIVKEYAGRIVISPDPLPTLESDLPAYLKANATKDDSYEAIKGSPWSVNLVGVLSADVKTQLTLELAEGAKPLHVLDVAAKNRRVMTTAKLTTAAGFEANKTYIVRLVAGKKVLAKAQLRLRD